MAKLVDLDGLKYFYGKIKAMLALKADDSAVVKSVNGTAPDTSGNVSVTVGGGGVSTDTANTWTAAQTFIITKQNTEFSMSSTITPTASSIFCYVNGNITLDLNTIAAQVAEGETMIFRAYLLCSGDGQYTLTVKSPAIALLYTGDPVDYAISKWGTILTAYITNPTGNSQPFVILNTSKVGL